MVKWLSGLFDNTDKELGQLRKSVNASNAEAIKLLEAEREHIAGIRAAAFGEMEKGGAVAEWRAIYASEVESVTAATRRLAAEAEGLRAVIEEGEQTSRDLSVLLADAKQLTMMNSEKVQRPPAERRELEAEISVLVEELSEQLALMLETKPALREAILQAVPKAKLPPQLPSADEMSKQVEATAAFLGREVAGYFSRTNETMLALRRAVGLQRLAELSHEGFTPPSTTEVDVAAQELVRALAQRDLLKHFTRQGLLLTQELKAASGVEDASQSVANGSKDGGVRRFGASRPPTPGLQPMGKDSLADELYWEEQATGELLAMAASAIGEKPQSAEIILLAEKFAGREEHLQARTSIFRVRIIEARTAFWQEIQGKIADVVGAEAIAPYAERFEELDKEQEVLVAQVEEQDSNWDLPVAVKPDTAADLMQRRDILENQTFAELMNDLRAEDRGAYDRLKALQEEFRKEQRKDEHNVLTELIPEAFAVIWEASRRTTALRPYDVQFIGGIVLFEGKIAEMKTGEGKTLVAVAPLYLNALSARGAHLCTVNEYLVKRDSDWMGAIYKMLGLSVGVILSGMAPWERKSEYASDITYGTTSEFGFDYLRDNIANSPDDMVQRPHNFCIVDEVDNILIDEARTPLIISGASEGSADVHIKAAQFAKTLRPETDYTVDEKSRSATLTDEGINRAEQFFRIDNLYHPDNFQLVYGVDNALKAHALFRRDKDYVLWQEGKVVSASERLNPKLDVEVVIVDEFTGRMMQGRRYSEGLHEAIEAKEGIRVQSESQTFATITIQNYFRLYPKLAGMTGTAATEAEEFFKIYKLEVMPVPTHRPMVRVDNPDRIYRTEPAKFAAVVDEIDEMHKEGRPVLVGTVSIEKSEELSKMLEERGVPHSVLNAKQHEREASIVAQAGQRGAVTIATNMAGRGTDITLGFGVNELGGLHIIGTERHESRRIDNQLRGRAGRQGDSGSSRFFVSVEDEIMRRSGVNQNIVNSNLFKNLWDETMPIEHSMISRSVEQAQVKMEGYNFDTRKHLVEYDDVVNTHRDVIYNERRFVIKDGDPRPIIGEMIADKVQEFAAPAGDDARKKRDRGATSGYAEMFDALKETFPDDILRRLLRSILTARVVPVLEEGDTEGFIEEIKLLAQEAYESTRETQVKNVDEKLQEFYHVGDEYYEIAGEGTLDYDKLTQMLSLPPDIVKKISAEEMDYDAAREFLSEIVRENFAAAQQPLLEKLQSFLEEQTRHANIPQENAPKEQLELLTRALVETIDNNFPLSPVSAARYVEAESADSRSSMMGGAATDGVVAEIRDQLELLYDEVEKTLGDVFIETNLQMPLISLVDNRLPRSVYTQIEERLGVEGLEQVENVPLGQLDPEAREVVKDAFVRWQESDLMLRVIDYLWTRHLTTMEQLRHSIGLQAYGQKDPLVQYKVKAYELFDDLKAEIRQLVVLNVLLMGAKAEAARAATRPAPPQPQREAQAPTNGRAQNGGNGKPRHSQSQARAGGGQRAATPAPVGAGVGPGHKAKIGRNDPCFCGSGRKYKQCHGR
ncbi:MAG: preprotein translocase subunit SecA [Chloroflexi bacterium]|nr:preprotein translocase subunit SecA [Chloroflexota bacterium]